MPFRRQLAIITCGLALLQLAGCSQPSNPTKLEKLRPGETLNVEFSYKADVAKRDGKVIVKLLHPTGIKEIDDINIQFLLDVNDGFKNLKEGERITVDIDPAIAKSLMDPK